MILSIVSIVCAFFFFRHFQACWQPFGANAKIVQSGRLYLHTVERFFIKFDVGGFYKAL
jgi:hypothetical protein